MDHKHWANDNQQAIGTGKVPADYQQAAELPALVKAELDKTGTKLTLAGHSPERDVTIGQCAARSIIWGFTKTRKAPWKPNASIPSPP